MKKFFVVFLALLVVTVAFSEKVIFDFWHGMGGGQGQTLTALANAFNAENPDVEVNLVYVGNYGALQQRLLSTVTAYMQGTKEGLPALAQAYANWTARFLFSDVVEPLNEYIEGSPEFKDAWDNQIYDVFKDMTIWGDNVYAIPYNKSTYVYYYNADLFDLYGLDVPKTFEDLIYVTRMMTEDFTGDGNTDQFGLGARTHIDDFQIFLFGFDSEFLEYAGNGQYKVIFDKNVARQALQLTQAMRDEKIALFEGGYLNDPFGAGQIAAYMGTIAGKTYVDASARGRMEWNWAPIPSFDGVSRPPIAGTDVVMFNWVDQDQRDASFRFMEFLLEPVNMAYWAINTGYLPVRRDVVDTEQWKAYVIRDQKPVIALNSLEHAKPDPKPAAWNDIRNTYGLIFQNFINNQISLEEALNRMENALYDHLEETGELAK